MQTTRPNLIFLMDDQHRWDTLGCVNPAVRTPHLDALARDGVRYDQAVCQAPACVPSRYSMMTGLYPSQVGVRTNADNLTDAQMPVPVLAQYLQRAGYQTAGFGKTHWGSHGCSTRGFEVRAVGQRRDSKLYEDGATMMGDLNPEGLGEYFRETEPYGNGEENIEGYLGRVSGVSAENHRDGWVTQQCLRFIAEGRDASRPLFLYLSFLKPHAAFNVPAGFEDQYRLEDVPDMPVPPWDADRPAHTGTSDWRMRFFRDAPPEVRRRTVLRYWANCTWIDSMFGQVLSALNSAGELDNTLIVYLSDHGEMLGDHYYRFSKYCLYEASVRVPMILSGSALPPALRGTIDQRPASLVDVMPTVLDIAGLDRPSHLVGQSLLATTPPAGSFCEFHGGSEADSSPCYMWRTPHAKLILYSQPGDAAAGGLIGDRGELYDLRTDPGEWTNLYDSPDALPLREAMTRDLVQHLARAWKRFPRPVCP